MAPAFERSRRRASPRYTKGSVLTTAFLFVVGIYFLLPAWWLFVSSTKGPSTLYSSEGLWFSHFELWRNLTGLFSYNGGIYLRWLVNTVLYAGVGALLATVFAGAAGFALAKYEFRGREFVFSVILGGVLVPATALALPLYLLMSKVGLTNTYWSVFLPSMVSPFGVYLARIYAAASVPDELLEAARLDGAGEIRAFFGIAARIMSPALVTIFLFQFVAIWNNFFLPLVMLSNERLYPVTLGLYSWNDQYGQAPQLVSYVIIGAAISVIPLIVAFLSLQRFWRSGLTSGSVTL
ncbi:ABC transporter permease subunit [Acidimicrobiaceae bacterium USS-CC1]|uniref:ABC transporter permease subunit n=1 Tax=Acidiferrimicrobium australe TaxID=2664430 RepID=A0ABW9QRM0_9ACTN|nr:ABC transporter permease subunit [Acidiferrimicrobium australe]